MKLQHEIRPVTRRELIQTGGALAGSALFAHLFPGAAAAVFAGEAQRAGAPPTDPIAAMRAQMAMAPMEMIKLTDNLTMLSGPGGNVVVLNGPDGKVVVDTFVQPVFSQLKKTIDGMGSAPIKLLINTHWHFDHTDNNANFRQAGAGILAHENTRKRLTETHELLGMTFKPAPANALATQTFKDSYELQTNGEAIALVYVLPAHTDTDISIHYTKANVLHLGDLFFNGMYPFIDAGTGGRINGMIAAADRALKMTDNNTKIVPGHGPLTNRDALMKYRDMMETARDRVQKLKSSGRKVEEVVAAKPTADLDATWGKGFMMPNDFVTIVYNTL
jgi:glyoxylase-like metal-dependent hydrolase (beta-lactamase superfamily II)